MRNVLRNHSEVAHFWANQTQESGRAGNMFFDRDTIYSYGRHYAIARIYKRPDGRQLVLFNDRGYSVSTAKHISIARHAVNHLTAFKAYDHAPSFGAPNHTDNMDYFIQNALSAIGKARRARKNAVMYADDRDVWESCFNQYIEFFDVDVANVPAFPKFDPSELATFQARRAEYDAQEEARNKAREEKRRLEMADAFEAWKNGGPYNWGFGCFPVALRVKGDKVETSLGASVTIEDARQALKAWKSGTLGAGALVGDYTTIRATKEGVQIGCHKIDAEAIEALAAIL